MRKYKNPKKMLNMSTFGSAAPPWASAAAAKKAMQKERLHVGSRSGEGAAVVWPAERAASCMHKEEDTQEKKKQQQQQRKTPPPPSYPPSVC
ncbi:hypothetical protein cyc_02619 [Cyclospora cayetanensis]|uniref:Uncharacterized protein n=1 Tax=Cyclospora cayetanensis TaxID=88456 RepID=A0A1D3D2G2_9EIME|nr:hypothetical protein cyc_02619 [Cyclospora cayetanensis]